MNECINGALEVSSKIPSQQKTQMSTSSYPQTPNKPRPPYAPQPNSYQQPKPISPAQKGALLKLGYPEAQIATMTSKDAWSILNQSKQSAPQQNYYGNNEYYGE